MNRPTGLYGWIQSNDGRSTTLLLMFVAALQVIAALALFLPLTLFDSAHAPFLNTTGYLIRYATLIFIASVGWFGWQFFWHIETVKRATGFRFVDASEEPRLCRLIEPLITMSGLPIPFVGVIETPARNAFACGIARKKAVVVVTRGLIDHLSDAELRAVLAHELGHIKHGDIRLMAAANIFVSGLKQLAEMNPFRFTMVHVVLSIAVPAILILTLIGSFLGHAALRAGQIVRLVLASTREFIADAESAQLTKNPAALASALVKVEHDYRVETARHEDDAMMIAGDTDGPDATHPTVAQRIAALARITGSMVFNSPGVLTESNASLLSEAQTAALLQRLPSSKVIPRVRAGSKEDWLGMTRWNRAMATLTIIALLFLHAPELTNARAMAAKFDVRPIAVILGQPGACILGGWNRRSNACVSKSDAHIYSDFEGQRNTLAGWLAQKSQERREAGFVNPDVAFGSLDGGHLVKREFRGISGKYPPVNVIIDTRDGLPLNNQYELWSYNLEVEKVGCFSASINNGIFNDHFGFQKSNDSRAWDRLVLMAKTMAVAPGVDGRWELPKEISESIASARQYGPQGTDYDYVLRDYGERRKLLVSAAAELRGQAGVQALQEVLATPDHRAILDQISHRLNDRRFALGNYEYERGLLTALTKAPEKFVPCEYIAKPDNFKAERPSS